MKEILKPRQVEILKHLMTSSVPLDIEFFKEKLLKSERTIRYDIQELKDICNGYQVEICYLTKKGYYIPASQKSACSALLVQNETEKREIFGHSGEEKRYWDIFFYLFLQKDYVAAEKIAHIIFMSRSTLNRMMAKMEGWFDHQLVLEVKKAQGYRLAGDELQLRRLAAQYLSARLKGSYSVGEWYLLLPGILKEKIQLHSIREISSNIRRMNAKYNIWISNTAYLNLMSYCIVRLVRVPLLTTEEPQLTEADTYVQELLKKISVRNQGRTTCELEWLSEILEENGIFTENRKVDEELVWQILDVILEYLQERKGKEYFHLEHLQQDLYEHLKSYLRLSKQNRWEDENTYIIEEIQESYYSYYQLAKECAQRIQEKLGWEFNIMEICYLAVYFYKNCTHTADVRKNVMVVCATGKGLSHFLTLRIKNVFPMLNVVGQISPYQLSKASDMKNVDFAISTLPLEHATVPVVKISGALLEEDIKRIQDFLRYGKMVDEIPMKQKDEASFLSKEDSLLLNETVLTAPEGMLSEAASTISKLILTLLEYTAKLPPKYQLSQDAMLGMMIHMSMAVPRWFAAESKEEVSEEFKREYYRVKEYYPDVFWVMEKFFQLVETTLQVKIPISERVAFFLYIIEEV